METLGVRSVQKDLTMETEYKAITFVDKEDALHGHYKSNAFQYGSG